MLPGGKLSDLILIEASPRDFRLGRFDLPSY
jgi:hypothetical protein